MNRRIFVILSLLALTVLALSACGANSPFAAAPTPTQVPVVSEAGVMNVEGRVVPKTFVTLAFPISGQVETIPVEEGASVDKGAVLVSLGKREQFQSALSNAKQEQLAAQQALDMLNRKSALAGGQAQQALVKAEQDLVDARKGVSDLDTDEYRNTLDDKEKAVQTAKDKLKDANDALDKKINLDPDNQERKDAKKTVDNAQKDLDTAIRDRDLWKYKKDQADATLTLAEARVVDAQKEVDNRKNGPDPDELALAQARLENAKAAVQAAQRALADLDITAPFAGVVADLNGLAAGQWINLGRAAVTLADQSEWFVETKDLKELDIVNVSLKQAVVVRPDALKGLALNGEVIAIKPQYTERSGDVLYTVRIKLQNSDERLRWGMTVQVSFETK